MHLPFDLPRIWELLCYDRDIRILTWRLWTRKVAGTSADRGYSQIRVDGIRMFAHRLAYLYMLGMWPPQLVDHEERCTSNKRWLNPRTVTLVGNGLSRSDTLTDRTVEKVKSANPKNPYPGVHMLGPSRFKAMLKRSGKTVHLGYFSTPEAANEAFEAAKAAAEEAA